EYALKASEIIEEIGDVEGKAIILNNLGIMEWTRGNYVAALNLFQQSLDFYKTLGNIPGIARGFLNLSTVYGIQGNYDEAQHYIFQAIELLKNQEESTHMAQALQRMGDLYAGKGDKERALENYEKSVKMFRQIGEDGAVANVLTSICNEVPTNLATCEENVSLSEKLGPWEHSSALVALASAYFIHQRFAEVIPLSERAAQLAKQIESPDTLQKALTLAGRAYLRLKNPAKAETQLAAAIHTIEDLRENIAGGEQETQRYFEKKLTAFQEMVTLLVREKRFAEALEYAERAKGRVLYDVLRQRRSEITRTLSPEEKLKEQQLREKLQSANLRFRKEKELEVQDSKLLQTLEINVEKQRMQYERYRALLYAAHPELRIQRAEFPPQFWKGLTKSLPHEKAFLQYVVTEDTTFLFLVAAGEPISTYQIDLTSNEIERMAKEFQQQLADRDPAFRASAKKLYGLLIKPVEKHLIGKTSLILVPDGQLWEVPFQALVDNNDRYLIESFPISYAHSLAVFSEMQKLKDHKPSKQPAVLAIGNPAFSIATNTKLTNAFQVQKLEPLPEAEKEVKNLAKFYDPNRSMVLIQEQAQEQILKDKAGDFETLHLATHGMINNSSPMYSYLLLSPGNSQDGLLEAWEISEMDLKARLIVLSACDTARGRIGPGEGVIGLSWALFIAGSPTALLSLWKVDSASTTELMIEFHQNFIAKRLPPDVAAQQAALQLMKKSEYLHPFYWAGFVVVGNGI
ncbi:MAG TPA: CHAT domain-containing protein, partial [Acidobacteriota bacterium]